MPDRSRDWFAQAVKDREQARSSSSEGRHEWACFAAHQSAEKALKALHLFLGQEAWGHVIARLLQDLPFPPPKHLVNTAKVLDNYYIPTRYPYGHPEGAPFKHYGSIQSEGAMDYAREILEFVRAQMAEPRPD